ncbi:MULTISPECIES: hypothetical protein [Streptomyces]|uniref:hypothetical protein n=1 Tax=Streptomyces TaxID=1883 RepID=UPI001902F207|nr:MULTISPECIES: hypothetical protein [unclassified Streptomyces]MCU4745141.1 hypothetical protein [Streptomyces sp. G-5]QQN79900.1 hypothetical protein IPZ77_22625 [Streptomyces sp. XC 2026]
MGHWLYRNIVEPGKLPLLLALAAFILTFVITRTITRLIRAGRGPFHDVTGAGGTHVHHVVPGVILMLIGGFGGIAAGAVGITAYVVAVLFGIGAGLVLDEFALILHLHDVYWSEQGRQSVELVVVTAALVAMLLAGFVPLDVKNVSAEEKVTRGNAIATVLVNFALVLITLLKGKRWLALWGVLVPPVALFGAVRLARPDSPWAHRLYRRRPKTAARAARRAERHDARWSGPSKKVEDWLGGTPTDEQRPKRDGGGGDAGGA